MQVVEGGEVGTGGKGSVSGRARSETEAAVQQQHVLPLSEARAGTPSPGTPSGAGAAAPAASVGVSVAETLRGKRGGEFDELRSWLDEIGVPPAVGHRFEAEALDITTLKRLSPAALAASMQQMGISKLGWRLRLQDKLAQRAPK